MPTSWNEFVMWNSLVGIPALSVNAEHASGRIRTCHLTR
jgi:hypothetical protein